MTTAKVCARLPPPSAPEMALALFLHVISAVVWVGGMFFAVAALRPASAHLPPAERMTVWEGTLARFFRWVLLALVLLLLTGFAMIGKFYGSMAATPLHIHLMMGLGILMMLAAIPLLLGFIVVLPVLGHATWHFYRRAVV